MTRAFKKRKKGAGAKVRTSATKGSVTHRKTGPERSAKRKKIIGAGKADVGRRPSGSRPSFPGLKARNGCGAILTIGERVGGQWHKDTNLYEVVAAAEKDGKGGKGGGAVGAMGRFAARTAQAFSAVGHAMRLRILLKLLEGPATYRSMQKTTKLKAGPLYHHINQLRLSGLILPKQRDLYELTRGGRNLMLIAMAAGPLITDPRRRPVGNSN